MEKELRALSQAEREIPTRWYENRKGMLAYFVVLYTAITLLEVAKFGDPVAHLTAAVTYIASAIADEETTLEGFDARDKARYEGFNFISEHFGEENVFFSHIKTAERYKAEKKKKLITNGLGFMFSTILPSAGIVVAGAKFLASINNHRVASRINRATEIAQNDHS